MKAKFFLLVVLIFLVNAASYAQLRLPKIIGNNMVLQRDKLLPIWGWTTAGERVTVNFAGQQQTAKADAAGYWKVVLSPMKANDTPQDMTITGGNTIKLSNLLIGEVWLCSGQSNMEYPMNRAAYKYIKPARDIDSAELEMKNTYPTIRLFRVEKVLSTPDVTTTGWNEAKGETLEKFSAAGFYFARDIQEQIHVPVGIIASYWGGSRIEPWTPQEAYKALPAFAADVKKDASMIDDSPAGKIITA